MRLSWNEIRARAAAFAGEWKDAHYEKGETQSFYNDLFEVFGVKRRSVARYEQHVRKLDNRSGFIDLFWPGVLLVEQKGQGRDLTRAFDQAGEYFDALKEHEKPRFILACDFQTFDLYDLAEREDISFKLEDLPANVERFGFILGVQRRSFKDQDPVNIKAAELVGALHDQLEESGFTGADLERFLVRLVFCLFADDTGVFEPRNLFLDYLEQRTAEDGSDLGGKLAELFQTLDTPEDRRASTLDEDLAQFPYVNGELFGAPTRIPAFDSKMREALIAASRFDWSPISPAIFGSLFQSVMNKEERRKAGAHYTTEQNIMKLIGPLFLDELRAGFERAKTLKRGRQAALDRLIERMAGLTFFDPACGCGNFLIIAYRELRQLEIECLQAALPHSQLELDAHILSRVDVDQFYGIEIGEFPSEIARAAMWMMDHIMNNRLSLAFGQSFARIPLTSAPGIVCGDALEMDWAGVLAPEDCDYVLGNPPFIGAKYQSADQRAQVRRIADLGKSGGTLDYVAAWFLKAGAYAAVADARSGSHKVPHIAFVSTNSITQGEQVAQLWPLLFERWKLEIAFAHRTFAWGSDARGKAHVHVVILGLERAGKEPEWKRLFSYETPNSQAEETRCKALSPYLFDAGGLANPHVVVLETSQPINGARKMITGSKPIDGGYYTFNSDQVKELVEKDPLAKKYLRPFLGAREYINGISRWVLCLQDADPSDIRNGPELGSGLITSNR